MKILEIKRGNRSYNVCYKYIYIYYPFPRNNNAITQDEDRGGNKYDRRFTRLGVRLEEKK